MNPLAAFLRDIAEALDSLADRIEPETGAEEVGTAADAPSVLPSDDAGASAPTSEPVPGTSLPESPTPTG